MLPTTRSSLLVAVAVAGIAACSSAARAQSQATVNVTGSISGSTCTVTTANLRVYMGQPSVSEITAVPVGSAIQRSSGDTIVINCQQTGANPQISFTDANNTGSTAAYLSLTQGGNPASGVGIQLFRSDGTAIQLGQSYSVGQNLSAGSHDVPFTARYYRTATVVTAGNANANAVFQFVFP